MSPSFPHLEYPNLLSFFSLSCSQLTLSTHAPHQCSSIAQAHLATCHTRHKSHLFPSILHLARPPHLRNQLVTRPNRARKPCRKLLDIRRIAAAKMLQQRVSGCIPAEEAMHYRAPETHLLSGFGSSMKRVVVAVQSIQPSSASFKVVAGT
jgi:hypothetical protein